MATKQINAVLVGCGSISKAWLDAIREMPDMRMVGLVDIREEAARARRRSTAGATRSWAPTSSRCWSHAPRHRLRLHRARGAPEAVTLAALRHGCHVLGEKPLADTMDARPARWSRPRRRPARSTP